MIRRMVVRPDQGFITVDGEEIAIVSREKMQTAMMELEAIIALGGGVASIVPQRFPTGVEHEMVTVGAIIEWKDAPVARPKVEPVAQRPQPAPALEELEVEDEPEAVAEPEEQSPAVTIDPDLEAVVDEHGEPEEDLGAIPASKRALVA